MPVRIALDAMGGDYGPAETARAALDVASPDLNIILFGDEKEIVREAEALHSHPYVQVVATTQHVEMYDHPVEAFRKKPDSSLRRAVEAVHSGAADGVVSAGNTGAAMAAAKLVLGACPGVARPAIGAVLPTARGKALLIDAGANVDCDPANLHQFALMGAIYAGASLGIALPTVGLINIGEEVTKGNSLTRAAHQKLQCLHGFVGNVEPREFLSGKVDVGVCDGFVGNVVLKTAEGAAEMIGSALTELAPDLGPEFVQRALRSMRGKMDYSVYGGAPLLGVNGVCLISHGRSRAFAIANAIRAAALSVQTGLVQQIRDEIGQQLSA